MIKTMHQHMQRSLKISLSQVIEIMQLSNLPTVKFSFSLYSVPDLLVLPIGIAIMERLFPNGNDKEQH